MRCTSDPCTPSRRGRRELLRHGLVGMGVVFTGSLLSRCRESTPPSRESAPPSPLDRLGMHLYNLGPLQEPDANGLRLAEARQETMGRRSICHV